MVSSSESVALLVGRAGDGVLLAAVAAAGWRLERIDLAETEHGAAPGRVGIAAIPDRDPGWLAHVQELLRRHPHISWIAVVSPDSGADPAVRELIAIHCHDYHITPLYPERLRFSLEQASRMASLVAELGGDPLPAPEGHAFVCRSPALKSIESDLRKIAPVEMPVLITGETGTGKELIARTVHHMSGRRDQPFVAVNCASMPTSLIRAELFGFEKGAFAGAHERRVGQLEAASGGTIFLDEIGGLDAELQALLLRFLEEKAVRRVGGGEEMTVDARVVAATHVDLEAAVEQGSFREELYHRLSVLRISVPPLRERPEDIEALAREFLARHAREHSSRVYGFSRSALAAMTAHPWPGNVRELINRVRRAAVMADGRLITPLDLQLVDQDAPDNPLSLQLAREQAEMLTLREALRRSGWNATRPAPLVGGSRAPP